MKNGKTAMSNEMETIGNLKERIMDATVFEVNEKGLTFTMDDVARRLKISKKTIYTVFRDKETLCMETVDYCFAEIKKAEQEIAGSTELSIQEKIKKIIVALPERYREIDFHKLQGGREKYPRVYKRMVEKLHGGWETTIALLKEGISCGELKPFPIPVFRCMVESTIEAFLESDTLSNVGCSYEEALEDMVAILWEGIRNDQKR